MFLIYILKKKPKKSRVSFGCNFVLSDDLTLNQMCKCPVDLLPKQENTLRFSGISLHRSSKLATSKNTVQSAPVTKSVHTATMFPCLIPLIVQSAGQSCLFFFFEVFGYLGEMAFQIFFY